MLTHIAARMLTSRLAVVLLACALGFGISIVHHAFHQTNTNESAGLLDRAITVCGAYFR
ncbi:MAG: hypothetical protein AAF391_13710 [Bacteroidota bacterium]